MACTNVAVKQRVIGETIEDRTKGIIRQDASIIDQLKRSTRSHAGLSVLPQPNSVIMVSWWTVQARYIMGSLVYCHHFDAISDTNTFPEEVRHASNGARGEAAVVYMVSFVDGAGQLASESAAKRE